MKKKSHKILKTAFAGLLILLVATTMGVRLVKINAHRPQIEAVLGRALGLQCTIDAMHLSLWPHLNLHADNVLLAAGRNKIVEAKSLVIAVKILPLFFKNVRVAAVKIEGLSCKLVKQKDGSLNILRHLSPKTDTGPPTPLPVKSLRIDTIEIKNSRIDYLDSATRLAAAISGLDCAAGGFTIIKDFKPVIHNSRDFLDTADLHGKIAAQALRLGGFAAQDITLRFRYNGGRLDVQPIKAALYGGALSGSLALDLRKKPARAELTYTVKHLDVSGFRRLLKQKLKITGRVDMHGRLHTLGLRKKSMLDHLDGDVRIVGDNLVVYDFDLDTILTQYEKSQNLDLLDIGSIFIVGPFGLLLGEAFDLSGTIKGMGKGKSHITRLVSDWRFQNGIAATEDVAFATRKNRIALKGKVNFAAQRFDHLEIAVLDDRGCAKFSQTVNGTFQKPEIQEAGFLAKTIVNPIFSLLQKGKEVILDANKCRVFYQGLVPHPAKD